MPIRRRFNKLVRDRIPERIESEGICTPIVRTAQPSEMHELLFRKLGEESYELMTASTPSEVCAECADIIEVLRAIAHRAGVPFDEIERIRVEKRETHGGFDRCIVLLRTERP